MLGRKTWSGLFLALAGVACSEDPVGSRGLELGTYTARLTGDVEESITRVASLDRDIGITGAITARGDLLELNVAPPKASLSVQVTILFIDQPRAAAGRFDVTALPEQGLPEQGVIVIVQVETTDGRGAVLAATDGFVDIEEVAQLEARGTVAFRAKRVPDIGDAPEFDAIEFDGVFRARLSG